MSRVFYMGGVSLLDGCKCVSTTSLLIGMLEFLVVLTIFMELGMPLTMTVDIFPGLRIRKGQLIGHGSDDRSIFEMKLVNIERPTATEETPDAICL